jgi:hypothetical protein
MFELCKLIWCGPIGLFRSRASLEIEILALRHQLNILRRKSPKRPILGPIDRLVFVGLYGCESAQWSDPAQINDVSGLSCRSASGPRADLHFALALPTRSDCLHAHSGLRFPSSTYFMATSTAC